MRMKISAGRKRDADVKTHCERIEIRADDEQEAQALAQFAAALTKGQPATLQIVADKIDG